MKKENKKYIGIFLIILGISLLIFLPFLTGHMATDSYNIYNKGYKQYNIDNPVVDGRMLTAIMNTIMEHLNIPIIEYSIISLVIAIIISCVAIIVIMSTIEKIKKPKNKSSEILLIIASYCTIVNVLYIENLHFVEAAVMACSILFYILAAKIMVQEGKRNTIKSIILLYLGIISYQGSISIFLLSVIVFAMCKNKDIKELIKIIAKAIGITLIGILLNSLQIKIVENIFKIKQQRGIKLSTILPNIEFIISNSIAVIVDMGNYIPKYSYIISIVLIESIIFTKIKKQNDVKIDKNNSIIIFEQIAIIILGIIFGYAVSVINTSAFWSGRIRLSIGAIMGFLWVHLWVKTDFAEIRNRINTVLVTVLILYSVINSINYILIMIEHKKLNEQDRQAVLQMEQYVKEYEQINNLQIKNIAVVTSKFETEKAYYPSLRYKESVIMNSGIKTEWSILGCYNYYTGEKLKSYNPTKEEQKEYLEQQKEYLCIKDTLYVTAYMY